ncbi:AzlC family ABC transporter permease [Nocardia sp. NPDC004260]
MLDGCGADMFAARVLRSSRRETMLTKCGVMFTISYMRSIWRTLDRNALLGIGAVCLAVGVIGISYGATAVAAGFPVWLPVLLGCVVLAGSSEFLFLGIVAAGGNPIAAVLAGLLVNARHVPYGLSVPDAVGTGWRRSLGVHLMNDESVAMTIASPTRHADGRPTGSPALGCCSPGPAAPPSER